MERSCETCDKKTINLRLCTGCRTMYYCSVACQRTSWKNGHKDRCKSLRNSKSTDQSENKEKKAEERNDKSSSSYTSKEENKKPKPTGNNGQGEATPNTNATNDTECAVCGKKDGIKLCSACKTTGYCSKACQRRDWPSHKVKCCEEGVEGVIKTKGFKMSEQKPPEPRKPRMFDQHMPSAFSYLFGGGFEHVDTDTRSVPKPNSLRAAINVAKESFPGHIILDDIDDIPQEFWGHRPINTGVVVVAFISRYHHYVGRHCVYIQDKNGEEIYIAFYFDGDFPLPYFRWSDVKPGKYICIRDPCIHFFADGSVGIRIDFPSNVKLFTV